MSTGVDLSQFFETFFDEAEELLSDMEQCLLALDIDDPDIGQLNAIFRAAHSIKGGAGTFGCFGHLADTTHLLENLLDAIRQGEMPLRKDMIDLFLETKDVLTDQVAAYRGAQEPDVAAYDRICAQLRELALEQAGQALEPGPASMPGATPAPASEPSLAPGSAPAASAPETAATLPLCISLSRVNCKDADALAAEMALLGQVLHQERDGDSLSIWLDTTASADDLEAVCCFIVSADQVSVMRLELPVAALVAKDQIPPASAPATPAPPVSEPAPSESAASESVVSGKPATSQKAAAPSSSTIRVGVEKVDQIINLVGELVITQAMLVQRSSTLDPVLHDRLLNGIEQLERNARDLQEAVMSIRMMPMDYVFSRFPRVVRESATKMNKRIRLTTHGQATELDKSLIERIIDPLTHLVRNSIDHGIETPEARAAAGKDPEGHMMLSAQHHGGQIVIEVSDDGAGLNRERILKKAMAQGMAVSEHTPDEELWQLIFAPGFSTAEKVTDISGRGVGMDVVRRNIQGMGGHIQLASRPGQGTTTRIILPLTLAILDGMSVKVGEETFILPLSHVTESMQPSAEQIRSISDTEHVLHVRGEYLPLVALHKVFAVDDAVTDITRSIAVILQAEDVRFALLVDHLIGQHQVVVKNLESNYRKIPGVSAATILGDGSVALIVDVFALMRVTRDKTTI
ncbi:chemotaxis protein CheA [Pollutimonas harenae]|uniref:Chemotaxis protein CheA n=1 Tax=Pollutimonas harenae TaxID=657015 RepID=A0A853GWW9_9BURK|nr:chemotaxis protein CheA [Pollutimonas harenae]NYT86647.1 chemotaxis protein CheA [Pollutimonas harenae]TEA71301.1 chemotaxis protein CheA [Pollutimonas harenae]